MKRINRTKRIAYPLLSGLVVGLLSLMLTVQLASAEKPASTARQEEEPVIEEPQEKQDCQECHLDVADHWSHSPHAHAFDDEVFQERWIGMQEPGECLACHTTEYQASTGEFKVEGVSCEACHGEVDADHPPAPVPIKADTEYCGTCHTTTHGEWRLTGHATTGIGCMDCHDPHSQQALFEEPDELCINCHEESMEAYLEDLHVTKGIGCVDCHALVIPPEEIPEDGIVPTGHAFTITPGTCVACHTDALHAGFSLPGYEHGAKAANGDGEELVEIALEHVEASAAEETDSLSPEQRVQALEAALANRNVTLLFQGGIVGLVLGGTTAWFVANNVRRGREEGADDEEE